MAIIYVSKSATNGYAVGNDSNTYAQSHSKATPKLTVIGAEDVAVDGDEIIINDGTYAEVSPLSVNIPNLTIIPENDYMVTLQSASGTSQTFTQQAAGTGLTIGRIIIDSQNVQNYTLLTQVGATVNDLTLDGTYLVNFNIAGTNLKRIKNFTMKNNWKVDSTALTTAPNAIFITESYAGNTSISNGIVNLISPGGTSYCVNAVAVEAGCNIAIHDVVMNYGATIGTASIYGIKTSGYNEDIHDNTCNQLSLQTSGTHEGIYSAPSAIETYKTWVYNNKIYGANTNPATNGSGHCVSVGEDGESGVNANTKKGIWVHGNKCYNTNHMVFVGWQTGAIVQGNYCNNGVIGVIGKHTTNCQFTGNILEDITASGALRAKGSNGDIFANNTVILKKATGIAMLATISNATVTSNAVFKNNNIYIDGVLAKFVEVSNDGSSATFANNNYYSTIGISATAFVYNATTYATFAEWLAAVETTALNVNPQFVNYPTDLRVPASNVDLYHKGTPVNAQNKDYRLRPFFVKPTIGAYEVTSGDVGVARLPRSA
jgi:hypothetical protein